MDKLVCRVELDKKKGVVVTVENGQGKITQTIVMDGTNITTTVKGSDNTSTITQGKDSVSIKCKTFTLDADTITCKSTGKTRHESKQDFEIDSTAKISVSAVQDAKYKAMNTTMESTAETKVKGMTLGLSGTATAEMKAPSITVDATGMMDLKASGIANIKGSIVNIKDIVNIG